MEVLISAIQAASNLVVDSYNSIVLSNTAISLIVLVMYVSVAAGIVIDAITTTIAKDD